jgi:hypothetical protein
MVKKEGKRNKKVRKEIKAYKLTYAEFQNRKKRNAERRQLKKKKLSNAKLSLDKNIFHRVSVSNKSLPNRNSKVLLPSIKSIGKEVEVVDIEPKKKANK